MEIKLFKRAKQGDVEARNAIIEAHLSQVEYVAFQIVKKLPKCVDVEDLKSWGVLGIVDAIRGFDPERGVKFKSYAQLRIRGKMLDSLRQEDWAPRLSRTAQARVFSAEEGFFAERGRRPNLEELAELLQVGVHEAEAMRREATIPGVFSLYEKIGARNDSWASVSCLHDLIPDDAGDLPEGEFESAELLRYILRHVESNLRQILVFYYLLGMNMREIGLCIGLSESRVCQLHARAIHKLAGLVGHEVAA